MGKADANIRHKSGKERTIQHHSQEDSFQAQVKKVVELTKCSSEDAAYVLCENDNNVDQAIIAIFDRPDENVWKENKKKTKKEVFEKENVHTNRRLTSGDRGRGDNGNSDRRNFQHQDRRPKSGHSQTKTEGGVSRGPNNNGRSGRFHNNSKDFNAEKTVKDSDHKTKAKDRDFPEVDSFSVNTLPPNDDDNNWKNGPLVFEPSIPPTSSIQNDLSSTNDVNYNSSLGSLPKLTGVACSFSASTETYTAAAPLSQPEKLSFAAVAAKSKKPQPPPVASIPPIINNTIEPSVSTQQHKLPQNVSNTFTPETSVAQTIINNDQSALSSSSRTSIQGTSSQPQQFSSPDNMVKESSGFNPNSYVPPSSSSLNVNQEFTDKLKNDIGLHSSATAATSPLSPFSTVMSTSSPAASTNLTKNRTLNQGQSFQTASPILDFITNPINSQQPSFSREVEFLTGGAPNNVNLDFQFGFELDVSSPHSSVIERLQQTPPKGCDVSSTSATALSYTDTCCLDYQSNDLRNNANSEISGASAIPSSLVGNNSTKLNGNAQLASQTQQQSNQTSAQQSTQQHSTSSASQQPQTQPQNSSQHSLQQQQQQMYTAAAAAQFPSYGFPYLYSPVANMRDVEQFTTLTPFPYGLNGMNQIDMQLSAMLPPSMAATGTAGSTGNASSNPQASSGGSSGLASSLNANVSQNHHQISQQQSQSSSQLQQQQHRNSATENKFQLQSGGASSNNGLPSLSGTVPFLGLGSASQQPGGHQSRSQASGNLSGGLLNNNTSTGNSGVAPPPGFSTPHFVPQQNLQSLFHMPSYGHTPMPFPLLFPGGPQQQQSQQRQQPPQNHHGQHLLQSQNHHQPQQRHAAATALGMDHVNFMDMGKYPQQNSGGNSTNNLQGLTNPSYHAGGFGLGSGSQSQQQQLPLHRNQSINQGASDW